MVVYVLMKKDYERSDIFSSHYVCTGEGVTSEKEAKDWVSLDGKGERRYEKITVKGTKNESH